MGVAALEGVRVLDLGIITAGAATSQVLADFGADVIKVESTTYTDPFRSWSQISAPGTHDPNASPPFQSVNRNKRGIAVDLKNPAGRDVFLELVAHADVVVENFRRGVLDRLGIGFPTLQSVNPRIVLLSLSSQGATGPQKDYISFGSPLEATGGGMAVTGYEPGEPVWTGNNVNFPDQLVSIVAPGMVLAALRDRGRTGRGTHVDLSQREAVTSVVGDTVRLASTTGTVTQPRGNRHEWFAPQGVYRTAGEDRWIAISVRSDTQWAALVDVLGLDGVPTDLDREFRQRRHDEIDDAVERRTRTRDRDQLSAALQAAGVAAAAVLEPSEVLPHEQLAALGFLQSVPGDPVVQRGFVSRLEATPGSIHRSAPRLGEHTAEVLGELLGYDRERIEALGAAVHVDTRPDDVGGSPGRAR